MVRRGWEKHGSAGRTWIWSSIPNVTLPFHPNGLTVTATLDDGATVAETCFSVGGFVFQEGETADSPPRSMKPKRRTL